MLTILHINLQFSKIYHTYLTNSAKNGVDQLLKVPNSELKENKKTSLYHP